MLRALWIKDAFFRFQIHILSSIEGHDIVMLTVKTLEGLRNENDFELFWQKMEKMRVQFDID